MAMLRELEVKSRDSDALKRQREWLKLGLQSFWRNQNERNKRFWRNQNERNKRFWRNEKS